MKFEDQYIPGNTVFSPNHDSEVTPEVLAAKQRFGIVGNSPALLRAIERAIKVAPVDLTVLISGESGAGKEFFPRIIHQGSLRRHGRYIAVNCGAIPEGTIDSELFGHEKGSFTGAIASRKGYFEEADGGTIFLDEVAELPLTTQARLLRVLETGEFLKVGSSTVQKTNVRIVAATNVNLQQAIAEGKFREDLYYRLSTVAILVPPLRARGADIELLARKFASDFAEKYHTSIPVFDPDARRLLLGYSWPGNVRQLKNVIEQISLFEGGNDITPSVLETYLSPAFTPNQSPSAQQSSDIAQTVSYEREREMLFGMILSLRNRIDGLCERIDKLEGHPVKSDQPVTDLLLPEPKDKRAESEVDVNQPVEDETAKEKRIIQEALERHDGKRRDVAKELGIPERALYRKIKEYGLN